MTEYDELKKTSEEYRVLHQRIHETFRRRAESREAWIAWEQACRTFHSYKSPTRFIESADGRQKLREGNPRLLEHAILFLELDPYMFGSGYAKKAIIRCIKNLSFSESQSQRLQRVVLQALDKFDRPEFRLRRVRGVIAASAASPALLHTATASRPSPKETCPGPRQSDWRRPHSGCSTVAQSARCTYGEALPSGPGPVGSNLSPFGAAAKTTEGT